MQSETAPGAATAARAGTLGSAARRARAAADDGIVRAAWRLGIVWPVRHLFAHMRDRRFWAIQAMVFAATGAHYAIEATGNIDPAGPLHAVALTALIVPLVYAALNFGFEGAVFTAVWSAALALPALWMWHEQHSHWAIEIAHLGIILPVGVIVAWRVDRETMQRKRAERTSAGLALLNEVAAMLASVDELESQIPAVLDRVVAALGLGGATLELLPGLLGVEPGLFAAGWGAPADAAGVSTPSDAAPPSDDDGAPDEAPEVITLAGKAGRIGVLTARRAGAPLSDEQRYVLSAVAHALQGSIENVVLRRQRQESLQAYARQVTDAHEDERLRLARELHDDTAQELVNLVRRLERLEEGADPAVAAPLADAAELGRSILQGVRRYSYSLRPPVLDDLGVEAAIELVVEDASQRLPGGAELTVTGTPRRLNPAQELALFRIAQEAVRNAEKHAGATRAWVRLTFAPDSLALAVSDNGHGFTVPDDITSLARSGHFGLVGMQERAELTGGRFMVRSSPGGTTITVEVGPAAPRERQA